MTALRTVVALGIAGLVATAPAPAGTRLPMRSAMALATWITPLTVVSWTRMEEAGRSRRRSLT
jgi:hypothetical protein